MAISLEYVCQMYGEVRSQKEYNLLTEFCGTLKALLAFNSKLSKPFEIDIEKSRWCVIQNYIDFFGVYKTCEINSTEENLALNAMTLLYIGLLRLNRFLCRPIPIVIKATVVCNY